MSIVPGKHCCDRMMEGPCNNQKTEVKQRKQEVSNEIT